MAEAAEESGKENFLSGRSDGRKFSEADRGPPQHGKRLKRKIPRRQAAAGRLAGDFRARLGRLIVRTALPCRLSSDVLNMVISSGSIFVFHPFTEWSSLATDLFAE